MFFSSSTRLISGILIELQSLWKEFQASGKTDTSLRRVGVLFSHKRDIWTFIVLFESKHRESSRILKFSSLHSSQEPNTVRIADADRTIFVPKLYSVPDLISHIFESVSQRNPTFLKMLASDIITSFAVVETDATATVSSLV